jgi:hypothetical protein
LILLVRPLTGPQRTSSASLPCSSLREEALVPRLSLGPLVRSPLTQSGRSPHILSYFAILYGFACKEYSYVLKRGIPYPSCEVHFRVAPSKLKRNAMAVHYTAIMADRAVVRQNTPARPAFAKDELIQHYFVILPREGRWFVVSFIRRATHPNSAAEATSLGGTG